MSAAEERLREGVHVEKPKGYPYPGTIVAAFTNLAGAERYVVESDLAPGMLHIFAPSQLAATATAPTPDEPTEPALDLQRDPHAASEPAPKSPRLVADEVERQVEGLSGLEWSIVGESKTAHVVDPSKATRRSGRKALCGRYVGRHFEPWFSLGVENDGTLRAVRTYGCAPCPGCADALAARTEAT